jgi:hypothetical protein
MSGEYALNPQSDINQSDRQVSEPPVNTGHLWHNWSMHLPWSYHPDASLQDFEHDHSVTPSSAYEQAPIQVGHHGQYLTSVPEDGEQTPRADTPWAYTLAIGTPRAATPRVDTPEVPPIPEVAPTLGQIANPYHLRARVRAAYQRSPDEVVSVVQRWFSNRWLDKLAVVNSALGWELSYQTARSTLYSAKRKQKPGWAKVYAANFNESYWWSDLLEELTRTGHLLGIEMKLRQQEYRPNVSARDRQQTQDHRWNNEQKTILCLLRSTYPTSSHSKVHRIMHNVFPNMPTSVSGIRERFRRMTRDDDPVWLCVKDLTHEQREEKYMDYLVRIRNAALQLGVELS